MSLEKDPDKKPKATPRKKALTKKQVTSTKSVEVTANIQNQINDVIEQAFARFYVASKNKQNKMHDLQHLDTIVAEYLQSFMILGYDINGEKVCISHAATPAARDSLIEHLRSTFLSIMNNPGNE